jgi:hypothetical protein
MGGLGLWVANALFLAVFALNATLCIWHYENVTGLFWFYPLIIPMRTINPPFVQKEGLLCGKRFKDM